MKLLFSDSFFGKGCDRIKDIERNDSMSYQQIKWLILLIPTVTIGLWEYVRHEFLLPYISMEMGNWLTPVILFVVTMFLLVKLFRILEHIQEDLHEQKAVKAALEEREKLARELHDGISQSLFLLAVKIDKLEQFIDKDTDTNQKARFKELRKTMQHVYDDVRHSIQTLKQEPSIVQLPWNQQINDLIDHFKQENSCALHVQWTLDETQLSAKEKVELYAITREALMNIQKHAECTEAWITTEKTDHGWILRIEDNGAGFTEMDLSQDERHGLSIIQDRAKEMDWQFLFTRRDQKTLLQIVKEG